MITQYNYSNWHLFVV